MKKNYLLSFLACGAVLVLAAACAQHMNSGEKTMALDQTPPPVQAGIVKVLDGHKADKITMESDDGKTTYEVEYQVNGQQRSAEFTAAGEMLEQENDIAVSSLPPAVSDATTKKYPSAKIDEASQVTAGGQQFYEIGIKLSDGKEREVQVNSDGSIRADKAEADEKD